MNDKEILRESARVNGIALAEIGRRAGYASNGAIMNRLRNKEAMRTDIFAKLLRTYGAKVIVRDKDGNEWEIE